MLKRSSMRELFNSLHDDLEQTSYEIAIAETIALKSLEKVVICELDVHEFARKFIELTSSVEIGKFQAISLNKYGQVEKLDFSEYGFDYVNSNRKGKFHSILKQEEAEKERSNLLILLYPSLEEKKEIYFSESSTCEDNDNLLDSYYSEESNYARCIEEVNRLIEVCKLCLNSNLQDKPLNAWQYIHEAFNEKIIFGVSKYVGNGRTYKTMRGTDYIKFTKEASQLFNKISCHPDGLVFNSDINEKWLNIDRSFELICNLHNSFSSEFEKLFLDALKEDSQADLVDLVDSLGNYPDKLTFQQRCELYKINLFDIMRLHDKADF